MRERKHNAAFVHSPSFMPCISSPNYDKVEKTGDYVDILETLTLSTSICILNAGNSSFIRRLRLIGVLLQSCKILISGGYQTIC